MDITLDLAQLKDAKRGLEAAIGEFDQAANTNDDLEDAIKRPDGRGDLLNQVIDFEVAWRDKRGKLQENGERDRDRSVGGGYPLLGHGEDADDVRRGTGRRQRLAREQHRRGRGGGAGVSGRSRREGRRGSRREPGDVARRRSRTRLVGSGCAGRRRILGIGGRDET
ncbi:hypothetical protein [Microbacterium maritypicum]|uniref:hypothetical protein n=1 Tax=Microbacterium maritypicum TaxID=33918 RepID=UPI0022E00BBD|nr:hypothetical protein [Microbacterium liquefaciens]